MHTFFKSVGYAVKGVKSGFHGERNIKIQFAFGVVAIILGLFINIGSVKLCLVIFLSGAILSLELFNTALERLIDQIHPEQKREVGDVKDILAGGVLVLSVASVIIGVFIYLPPLLQIW